MRRFVACLVGLMLTVAPVAVGPAPAVAADCQFVLGFLTLQQMIPAEVGSCVTDVRFNPTNGDALQATTGRSGQGGLLVWRKSDNFTAFTDGFRTWVNGPFGLQTRLNSQRFFWEPNPAGLPILPPPAAGERCHTAGLSLELDKVDAGAGNFVGTFRFTNNLSVPCTFFGFVGAQMLDAGNNPLPTNVVRGGGILGNLPGPSIVSVPAGGSAIFKVHWTTVPVGNEVTCPTSSTLNVIPPNEFSPLNVAAQITACGGGRVDVSAVQPATDVSRNWSGYAATGGNFTAVTGTWTVLQPESAGIPTNSSSWVGIGGFLSRDLIQAGTADSSSGTGLVQYDAWIELLPAPPQFVPLPVTAGDSVTVSISEQSSGQWLISIRNNTTGRSFQTTVNYASSRSSAEWVLEAPSGRRGVLPLDVFDTVPFSRGTAVKDGRTVTIAEAGAQALTLIDAFGHPLATPSGLTADGTGFSVARTNPALAALRQ